MKKFLNIFIFIFILININILGGEFIKQSNNLSDFIPKDWKIIELVEGDLNKDGLTDAVIIIQDTNFLNFEEVEYFEDVYPLEPRAILVLFKNKNGKYTLISKNNEGFITSDYSLYDDGSIPYESAKINKNNTLALNFGAENGLGGGNWDGQSLTYIFRWQNNRFELIGFEYNIFYKQLDDIMSENISINFSTNKIKETFSYWDDNRPDKVKWKNIRSSKKFILDELKKNFVDEIFLSY